MAFIDAYMTRRQRGLKMRWGDGWRYDRFPRKITTNVGVAAAPDANVS